MTAVRNPLVPIGFVLVALGFGNWHTGRTKVAEHEQMLAAGNLPARVERYEEFRELSAHTNATLLRPLQAGSDATSVITEKLDFYRVVRSGGRMLMLLGLFSAAAGMIHGWYRQRQADQHGAPPQAA